MVGLAACAESFGAVCRKAHYPTNWVHSWSKEPFRKKSCAPPLLRLASSLGTEKKCTAIFTAILPQLTAIYRNFFRLGGPQSPPPPSWTSQTLWHSAARRLGEENGRDFGQVFSRTRKRALQPLCFPLAPPWARTRPRVQSRFVAAPCGRVPAAAWAVGQLGTTVTPALLAAGLTPPRCGRRDLCKHQQQLQRPAVL